MATTYTITVQSTAQGNKYFVNGVQQDSLTLQAGQSYIFDQSDASNAGHPLALSATSDGTHGGGSEYTYNVTKTGTVGTDRLLYFSPDNETTTSLYYYCEVHSGMGGSISVSPQTQIDPQVNFFKSTLSGTYADDATSLTIATGDGALLPDPAVDGEYNLTIFRGLQVNQNTTFEIVRVLSKSGDVLTVNRGIESTTALTVDSEVHSILMSATKKVFNDIDTQIDNLEVYDQTLNTTSDVAFNSVDVENTFLLPIKTSLPSSGTLGEIFYLSPKETVVFFDGSAFRQIDASYLIGLGVATAQVTANGITLAVDNDFIGAQATASANDATITFLSSASRSLGLATATASGFTADAIFKPVEVDFLLIAGGGAGGSSNSYYYGGGGGGAGGYICSVTGELSGENSSPVAKKGMLPGQNYSVTIGGGGARVANTSGTQNRGNNSVFDTITANYGASGESGASTSSTNLTGGGSGGGAESYNAPSGPFAGTANQGHSGGTSGPYERAGGGGGAGEAGLGGGGRGGNGIQSSINGTATYRAGGGGGGWTNAGSAGGLGGGGAMITNAGGANASAYTGGGGGGSNRGNNGSYSSGAGGSGILILNYPDTYSAVLSSGATSLSGEITIGNGRKAIEIITSGNVKIQ